MEEKKRINVVLDAKLHKELKFLAVERDTTVTQFVIDAINEKIKRDKESN